MIGVIVAGLEPSTSLQTPEFAPGRETASGQGPT